MNKLSKLFKNQPTSTQAHKTEKANSATIFSRGNGSGNKLLLSLKNLFFRTDKSSASATVKNAVPQAATESIKTENKKSASFEPDQQTRLRMAYRNLLDPKGAGLGPRGRDQGYEQKVSHFDSAVLKVLSGRDLNETDENILDEVLPKLKKAIEVNGQLDKTKKNELLSDLLKIRNNLTDLQMKSALKAAWQGS